jgi:hypothetical protein
LWKVSSASAESVAVIPFVFCQEEEIEPIKHFINRSLDIESWLELGSRGFGLRFPLRAKDLLQDYRFIVERRFARHNEWDGHAGGSVSSMPDRSTDEV